MTEGIYQFPSKAEDDYIDQAAAEIIALIDNPSAV